MRDDNDLSKPGDSVELDQVDTDPRNDVSPPRKLRDAAGNSPKAKAVEVLGRSHSNGIVGMGFYSFSVKLHCGQLVQMRKEQKGCRSNIAKGVLSDWPSQKWSRPSLEVTNPLESVRKDGEIRTCS